MQGPGMWMPKQKDGLNWIATVEVEENGERYTVTRKARVQAEARQKVQDIRDVEQTKAGVARNFRVISSSISPL